MKHEIPIYQCDQCTELFVVKDQLLNHYRTHTGESTKQMELTFTDTVKIEPVEEQPLFEDASADDKSDVLKILPFDLASRLLEQWENYAEQEVSLALENEILPNN